MCLFVTARGFWHRREATEILVRFNKSVVNDFSIGFSTPTFSSNEDVVVKSENSAGTVESFVVSPCEDDKLRVLNLDMFICGVERRLMSCFSVDLQQCVELKGSKKVDSVQAVVTDRILLKECVGFQNFVEC